MGIFLQSNIRSSFFVLTSSIYALDQRSGSNSIEGNFVIQVIFSKERKPRTWKCFGTNSRKFKWSIREDKILFKVSQRSVRDRFNVLKNNFAKRQREEERASGISPEICQVDECLEDIIEVQRKR